MMMTGSCQCENTRCSHGDDQCKNAPNQVVQTKFGPYKMCPECGTQYTRSLGTDFLEHRASRLVTRILEAEGGCDWPVGSNRVRDYGTGDYLETVYCGRTVVGHDKNGAGYCKRHVPAENDRETVPEEPED